MEKIIYFDGKLLRGNKAKISVRDHGLLYGNNLFETMRCYNGKIFCLKEHLERLQNGAVVLGWPAVPDADELAAAVVAVLSENNLQNATVRLMVTAGEGAMKPDMSTCIRPIVIVFANEFIILPDTDYEQGWRLSVSNIRRNQFSPLSGLKSANYLDNILARNEAKNRGANEALLLNTEGMVAEGTISNIFLVKNAILVTPDTASGLLPGIMRRTVLRLAKQAQIPIEERKVSLQEFTQAEEVFITNSLLEIMPIIVLNNLPVGSKENRATTELLHKLYRAEIQQV